MKIETEHYLFIGKRKIKLTESEFDELRQYFERREYIPYPVYPSWPNYPYWPNGIPPVIYGTCSDEAFVGSNNDSTAGGTFTLTGDTAGRFQ